MQHKKQESQNPLALVTGASQRIGKRIAVKLAESGWDIAVHYNNSESAAKSLARSITDIGGKAVVLQANLQDEDATASLVARAQKAFSRPVTCLVNNASVFEFDTVTTADKALWDNHMTVNLRAPFVLSQQLAKHLPAKEKANIINILDQRVWNLTPYFSSYTLSKAALWTATQTLALALAPCIRVNGIGPGPTLPSPRQTAEHFAAQAANTPLAEPVNPDDIAAAVLFVLQTPSMTGQMLALDSGQHLAWRSEGPVSTSSRPLKINITGE